MLRTVAQLKDSRIPPQLGLCKDDPRLLQYFNEAEEDLLNHGAFWGTVVTAEFCTYGGIVAWPRNVADVLQITLHGITLDKHNLWYRYISPISQPSICSECQCRGFDHGCGRCGSYTWNDEGTQPTFSKFATPCQIRLYPRTVTDVGKKILLQGHSGGQWVSYPYNGIYVDGEQVTLASPFGLSATIFDAGGLTGVQKAVTNANVLAYAYDPATQTETPIANWQPDETTPVYRMSRLPHLCCQADDGSLQTVTIRALIKLEHIDVVNDTDWLIIQNAIAIKHGIHARQLYEQDQGQAADIEMKRAISALNHELRTHSSDKVETMIDLGCQTFRLDRIPFV